MEINELSQDEKLALVALVEMIAAADGLVSEGEESTISGLAAKLGDDTYRRLVDESERRFRSPKAVKKFLTSVSNPAARELIYGTAMEEAMTEPSGNHELMAMLDWLKAEWQIDLAIESETENA